MQDKIVNLYDRLKVISDDFLDYQKRNDFMPIRECLNEIQEFAVWFMGRKQLDIDDQTWQKLKKGLWIPLVILYSQLNSRIMY